MLLTQVPCSWRRLPYSTRFPPIQEWESDNPALCERSRRRLQLPPMFRGRIVLREPESQWPSDR
jgi:hypothetical protein